MVRGLDGTEEGIAACLLSVPQRCRTGPSNVQLTASEEGDVQPPLKPERHGRYCQWRLL